MKQDVRLSAIVALVNFDLEYALVILVRSPLHDAMKSNYFAIIPTGLEVVFLCVVATIMDGIHNQ